MKKILLISMIAFCFKAFGGQLDYNFANSTSTYTNLSGPNVLSNTWTKPYFTKLPFQFSYFGKNSDSLYISPYGLNVTAKQYDFISMGQESYETNTGEISYLISGAAPNRIVKVQFKDLSVPTMDTTDEYTVNYQIWLYETSNNIEFHFGPSVVTDLNVTEFYFGFRNPLGNKYLAVSGTVASPTLVQVLNVGTFKGLSSQPVNGTVYTFSPYIPQSGFINISKPYAFASSSESFSFLSNHNSTIVLSDLSGKRISESVLNENSNYHFSYAMLAEGMYLVTIRVNNQLFTEKIMVR